VTRVGVWGDRPERRSALGIGAFVGFLAVVVSFRLSFVLGTDPFWLNPRGDVKMQMTGYLHFIDEPWGWPLGVSRSIAPPHGFNVARADTTPLVALFAKLVRPIVPHVFDTQLHHPYGLWLALVFILQGVMAVRLAWALDVRTRLGVACAALFACTLPAFLIRSGHTSLDAHFFLLWALFLVITPEREKVGKEWIPLLGLVSLVHAYLLVMCCVLFVAWIVITRARRWLIATSAIALPIALMAAVGIFAEPLHWAPHFGEASFNPAPLVLTRLALVNPLARFIDPANADGTGYQYEGYDYLGLGVLVLFVAFRRVREALRRHAVLAVALGMFILFAFSNRVFVGRWLLVSFDVPESLKIPLSQFRSSGRFVWVPTYALLFFLIARAAKMGRRGQALLVAACTLQLVDIYPHFGWIHELYGAPDEAMLEHEPWDRTLARHGAVWTYPSFDCAWMMRGEWDDPNFKTLYQLSYRAALEHKIVNSIHDARPGRDCLDDVHEREIVTVGPDALVVFMRRAATGQMLDRVSKLGARCLPFDRGFACSNEFDDTDVRAFAASAAKSHYELGSTIVFGGDGNASAPYEGGAWGIRTPEGAYVGWPIEGSRSTIHFMLDHPRVHSQHIELEVDAEPGLDFKLTDIRVESEGRELEPIELAPGESATVHYRLKPTVRGRDAWVSLDLFEAPGTGRARLRVKRVRLREHSCKSKRVEIARDGS
jgi:hypothetical protein